ncbi:MarR family transcriptional regulator [Saccharothrix violaceirubra]|uniref:DNA-binding transcriptional regulator GbsR (MarR family) n=1 Tax=Saccharothrix violaceirubra TaxID=413306 RepID=A0A7W7WVD8_9PSEU|nr:MarR family transcriptional regulator [Saccharothrix violaceirubra]MBB4964951.1 DNA-binding transcriptional regulator GbsR (MarR family) [Saccharothrix violaceirubra]
MTERDPQAVLRFIERFSALLTEAGMPRMPSRVFVALLCTDAGALTAAELAELLRISPAAVSGAIRYLTQVNLVARERETGSRRDVYRVYDSLWHEAIFRREQMLHRWEGPIRDGIGMLGADTPAGQRINETFEFFRFMSEQMSDLLARWRAQRADLRDS